MYYFDPHEIISSLVTPLMDTSKRAREYVVEISLNDAPVRVVRRLSVPSNLYVGHFVYVLVYAMGWDGYHLTELTQGDIENVGRVAELDAHHDEGSVVYLPVLAHPGVLQPLQNLPCCQDFGVDERVDTHAAEDFLILGLHVFSIVDTGHGLLGSECMGQHTAGDVARLVRRDGDE